MRALVAALGVAAVLAAGCSAGESRPTVPDSLASPSGSPGGRPPLPVRTFDVQPGHVDGAVEYEQTPPVGGKHNPRWLACDRYEQPVPDEAAVHSLEHGAVWITYRPGLARADVDRLAELLRIEPEYVLLSPYEGLPSPVVASAWGLQLQVESAGDGRLAEFVRTYAGGDQGGEPGAPCKTGGVTPDQAREAIAD